MRSTREWGDGATDQREHIVEDISWARGWLRCKCGERLVVEAADSVERHTLLANEWRGHGGKVFEPTWLERDAADEESVATSGCDCEDPDWRCRWVSSLDNLREVAALCTCATMPVEQCPNYLPGDDEEVDDDETD